MEQLIYPTVTGNNDKRAVPNSFLHVIIHCCVCLSCSHTQTFTMIFFPTRQVGSQPCPPLDFLVPTLYYPWSTQQWFQHCGWTQLEASCITDYLNVTDYLKVHCVYIGGSKVHLYTYQYILDKAQIKPWK